MYLHLGRDTVIPLGTVVGIFDLDNTTYDRRAARYLSVAEKQGRVVNICDDIPRSAVLCEDRGGSVLYISQLSPATLLRRAGQPDAAPPGGAARNNSNSGGRTI